MAGLDEDVIRHALQMARTHGFRSVSLKLGKDEFSATLSPIAVVESASPSAALVESTSEATPAVDVVRVVPAPCVGYVRFVEGIGQPGDRIEEGSVVALISALGMDTEVVSPCGGEVSQVLVADGDAVQYGQPLMEVTL